MCKCIIVIMHVLYSICADVQCTVYTSVCMYDCMQGLIGEYVNMVCITRTRMYVKPNKALMGNSLGEGDEGRVRDAV